MIAQANRRERTGIGKRGRWSWGVISEKGGMWGPFKTKERAMLTLARVRKYFAGGGSWYREEGPLVVGQVRRSPEGWEYAIPGAQYVTYHADKAWKTITRRISMRTVGRNTNDREREMWVQNDEGLYNDWRRSRLSMREYLKRNRAMLDQVIGNVTSGRKPAHYLAYPTGRAGQDLRPRLYANAAAGAEKVVVAFLEGRKAREGSRPDYKAGARYETDGTSLVQWGSVIARKVGRSIEITDAGWRTKTTMAMLNAVLRRVAANATIYQKRHEWFLSTMSGAKPWSGKAVINLDSATVQGNRGKRRNPLTVEEAKWSLRRAGKSLVRARKGTGAYRPYLFGKARGRVQAVVEHGPKKTAKVAARLADTIERESSTVIPNSLSCLKNLHTARERAYAKRLITRYWMSGKAALVAGKVEKAAHAYGALAAIKRIARFELPHAQTVANLASFRMDLLRRSAKDLARYRKGAR